MGLIRMKTLACRVILTACLVDSVFAHSVEGGEEGAVTTIAQLRGRAPEIGGDDIWDNKTLPSLRCKISNGGKSGCTQAPDCGSKTSGTQQCTQTKWSECRGCWRGAPSCATLGSGFSCGPIDPAPPAGFTHRGGGEYCNMACCYRLGSKTHTRQCASASSPSPSPPAPSPPAPSPPAASPPSPPAASPPAPAAAAKHTYRFTGPPANCKENDRSDIMMPRTKVLCEQAATAMGREFEDYTRQEGDHGRTGHRL